MGVDESRENNGAVKPRSPRHPRIKALADRGDFTVQNPHVAKLNVAELGIHGHHIAATNEQRAALRHRLVRPARRQRAADRKR
jgi:hypothetical protein